MPALRPFVGFLVVACALSMAHAQAPPAIDEVLRSVILAPGFDIQLASSTSIPGARSLALSGNSRAGGNVITYVSTGKPGKVYALLDRAGGDANAEVVTLLEGLDTPVGIAWLKGSLYVSGFAGGKGVVQRYDDVDTWVLQGKKYGGPPPALITDALPSDKQHGYHYLRATPDGTALVVSLGVPCNVCPPSTAPGSSLPYGSLLQLDLASRKLTPYATGIRNSVGFDWRDGVLHFTDNGRDQIGDDRPDCELNAAPRPGLFFGFPYCQTQGIGDPYLRNEGPGTPFNDPTLNENGQQRNCAASGSHVQPVQALGPHTAPLGMRFYRAPPRGTQGAFPAKYNGAAFVALHGSWNRALKSGYAVHVVRLNARGASSSYERFALWLQNEGTSSNRVLGRPADVEQLPDGSLLVSDDSNGVVYRITHTGRTRANSLDDSLNTANVTAAADVNTLAVASKAGVLAPAPLVAILMSIAAGAFVAALRL